MEQPTSTPKPKTLPHLFAQIEIGASEIMYLAGLALLFLGFFLWRGLDAACIICGGVLVVTALIDSGEAHHAAV